MPFYQKRGIVPDKRHTQFRDKAGKLYSEELISRNGFSGIYSNLYHVYPPTGINRVGELEDMSLSKINNRHQPHHLLTKKILSKNNSIFARVPLFYNNDLIISKANIAENMDALYRNGNADELIFIHHGKGILKTNFGNLNIVPGDYLVIPRGVIYNIQIEEEIEALIIESFSEIEIPDRYKNKFGQLLEHAPFCERDIRTPKFVSPIQDQSIELLVKLRKGLQLYEYQHHPFDLIGWDGYFFPYTLNINDFMPITGKIHQPPPVHQTFKGNGFVICSFVPRLFDYHPKSIPAPYSHSNVDSDEIIYYADGEFMSRRGIEEGSITHHPMGLPHGPQPGKTEESIGATKTNELAVMIDTFEPLNMTKEAHEIEDDSYPFSWIKK